MSKKNVALVVLIVCFLTIMVIAVFGNSAITGIKKIVQGVNFYDEDGSELPMRYYLGDKEVIRKEDELGTIYYEYSDTHIALTSDEESAIYGKYFAVSEYRSEDVLEIDGKRYFVCSVYAFVNPGDAYSPRLSSKLEAHMDPSLEQRVENETLNNNGDNIEYLTFKFSDENANFVPFKNQLADTDSEGNEITYTVVKFTIYIEFCEVADYDPNVLEGENSYKEAVREACNKRNGSVELVIKTDKDSGNTKEIPTISIVLQYVPTEEEMSVISDEVIIQ